MLDFLGALPTGYSVTRSGCNILKVRAKSRLQWLDQLGSFLQKIRATLPMLELSISWLFGQKHPTGYSDK